MNSVNGLLEYVNSKQVCSEDISTALDAVGPDRLRVVSLEILDWLEYLHRGGRIQKLELRSSSTPHRELALLVREHGCFADLLAIEGDSVTLNHDISAEARATLLQLVVEKHKKTVFVNYKPRT